MMIVIFIGSIWGIGKAAVYKYIPDYFPEEDYQGSMNEEDRVVELTDLGIHAGPMFLDELKTLPDNHDQDVAFIDLSLSNNVLFSIEEVARL